jgi:hypothetical protein
MLIAKENVFNDLAGEYDGHFADSVSFSVVPETELSIRVSQVELCWDTVTNVGYQLQYRSSLTTNVWLPFGGAVVGGGSRFCTNDVVAPGEPQKYYQLLITP